MRDGERPRTGADVRRIVRIAPLPYHPSAHDPVLVRTTIDRRHGWRRGCAAAQGDPGAGLRLRRLSRRAGSDHRPRLRRRRRAGADAHRRRQEPVLPDAGHRAAPARAGPVRRGQPADRADARPGRRAGRGRRACGIPELVAVGRRGAAHRARDDERAPGAALRGARAAEYAALPGAARFAARARAARPVRHRRGALRQPVGPRLPRGLPGARRAARALSRRAAHRAHRHRRRADARRHRRAAAAARRAHLHQQLRPAEHPLCDRREGRCAQPAAALHQRRARGRCRHRLLPVAQARSTRPRPG